MSSKTTFWYALLVALAVIASSVAVPLNVDVPSADDKENVDTPVVPSEVQDVVPEKQEQQPEEPTKSSDVPAVSDLMTGTEQQGQQSGQTTEESASVGSELPVVEDIPNVKPESDDKKVENNAESGDKKAENTASIVPDSDAKNKPSSPVLGSGPSKGSPAGSSNIPESFQSQRPTPYPLYTSGVHSVKVGQHVPLFMEFFQPFQSFQPFQPFQSFPQPFPDRVQQPIRYQQQPFGAPFDPFAGPIQSSPFNQLVNAYTNEFKTPEVIIVKPKRNTRLNATSIPPIPFLLNIMLNAFRQKPSDMLASFDKTMMEMENMHSEQKGQNVPLNKTTSKTEIIDGHVVQINETTYTDGDDNHKNFYHFKEIQVLPKDVEKKIAVDDKVTVTKEDLERLETNEIKHDSSDAAIIPDSAVVNQRNVMKKSFGLFSSPPAYRHHIAAASNYAPYAPYYGTHASVYNVPSPNFIMPMNFNGVPIQVPPAYNYNNPQAAPPAQNYNIFPGPSVPTYNKPQALPGPNYNILPSQPANNYNKPPAPPANNNYKRPPALPANHFNGPADERPLPISLEGDTKVNELMAAEQQASGMSFTLPPGVELIDVNEKPPRTLGGSHFPSNHYHQKSDKFAGRKN